MKTKGPVPQPMQERFESKVCHTETCWLWQGTMHRNGYGLFHVKIDGTWLIKWAHRVAFELYKRPLLTGDTVDHLCSNPRCVNPAHLDAVPIGENSRRSPRTLTGINARKTHCPSGHAYANYGYLDQGKRKCRICVRARNRRADALRRAKLKAVDGL